MVHRFDESRRTLEAISRHADRRVCLPQRGRVNVESPKHQHNDGGTSCTATAHNRVLTINTEMWSCTFLDGSGRPSFNTLQNYGSATAPVFFYVFDLLILAGRDLMREPLSRRRQLLQEKVLSNATEPIRQSPVLEGRLSQLVESVREQSLEGLIAKRLDSLYEPGQRSGAWRKMRVNQGQEFVIGGYTPSSKNFDALIFGYYEEGRLLYAARTRNGFTPRLREELFRRLKKLETLDCPFANLPEARSGRWGQGLTKAKMAECRWLKPVLVGQFEFVEWTPDNHLRHSRFIGLREDKAAREVRREEC
jgi:ATP-dependent DNA ligase